MKLSKPIRLLLLGAPGSGKGTQTSRLLKAFLGIKSLSSGDTLRAEIARGSNLGDEASRYIHEGLLVPNSTMVSLIKEQLSVNYWLNERSSWLLDGFPRTRQQAERLDEVLGKNNANLNLVVELDVNQDVILQRVEARWVHLASGRVYNLDYNPPKVPFKDDVTGEDLLKRSDDTAEVFQKRLDLYNQEIDPLRDYYESQGILSRVSGDTSDLIFPQLAHLIEAKFA
ncbi:Adenylate kinase [Metschnikowia aff. pulcherrima]|uniref:GTP:AMP phosphotransferase, mitochondrial n=1 Tax=Metschnikowia aff. pulcherrima TaxID=2163413 RepID=A0A4P6XJK5_9ASCO|nr:Adenylate kinase [Metschnikowia aff. pulcherrima]